MLKKIEKALKYIPDDCEYAEVVRAVMKFHSENPDDWRRCFLWIKSSYGYDRYPGCCHIIPNAAVIILALLYGEGDFSKSITICNMCGWDTDCNVANVGCILGVKNGIEGIDKKWTEPIHDFLACSGVIGSLNAQDIPYFAGYFAKQAYRIAGVSAPGHWADILENRLDTCHFEFPGSTHNIRFRGAVSGSFINTDETAGSGKRSLKINVYGIWPGDTAFVYKKTYYTPEDFTDSRYDPAFSPLLYPGQKVTASVMIPKEHGDCRLRLYAKEARTGKIYKSEPASAEKEKWQTLTLKIPALSGGLISEAGVMCTADIGQTDNSAEFYIDDLSFEGTAEYSIDFSKEREEKWNGTHTEISQFTRLKGIFQLEGNRLYISCSDFAEGYTGNINWRDYSVETAVTPVKGNCHFVNFRVQGAVRSYRIGFNGKKFGLYKNKNGYRALRESDFIWEAGRTYRLKAEADKNSISVFCDNVKLFEFTDKDEPYLSGCVGLSVENGSRCGFSDIAVKGIE